MNDAGILQDIFAQISIPDQVALKEVFGFAQTEIIEQQLEKGQGKLYIKA